MTALDRAAALADLLPRPLDPVRSVKLKVSILLLVSGAVGLGYLYLVYRWQPPIPHQLITVALVLLTAQILGNGMTRPLREMTAAALAMARGDYSRRIRATSRDEVGQLAAAFNQMAADLDAADQQRRELIANVSHELRTPIAALQAVLENLVDGVAAPDPATLSTALSQTQRLGSLVSELLDLSRLDAGRGRAGAGGRVGGRAGGRDGGRGRGERPASAGARSGSWWTSGRRARRCGPTGPGCTRCWPTCWTTPRGTGRRAARSRYWRGRVGEQMEIDVRDEGPGIAAADRERVFDRFTRGERAVGGGTGLGLAIARWAVDLHGGRIAVLDPPEPGAAGCRIRVTLVGAS